VHEREILVIDPAIEAAESEGAREVAAGWPGAVRVLLPALRGDRIGDLDPAAPAGVVVMGSAASVHDGHPWLVELEAWLQPIVSGALDTPVLGICFGHQLLAHCLGASVGLLRSDRSKELGLRTSRFASSRLFADGAYEVVVSHNEVVTDLPGELKRIAWRNGVDVDGFEHESRPIFGVQFHPEGRSEFAVRRGIDLGSSLPAVRRDGQRILAAFRGLVEARAYRSQSA
jgi:GMP synthase (glutamine-hydrolysing)